MKIVAVCKEDFITTHFSFIKGVEYLGYNHVGSYITLLDDNNEPYYFNDNNFGEHFDDKKKLRKNKLEKINESNL